MDLVLELVHLVAKHPPKSFDSLLPPGTKSRKLFDAVLSGQVHLDEEAAQHIYQNTPNDKKYLMLKRNLIQKLFELVLLIDHSGLNPRNFIDIQFRCERELSIAKKLLRQNVYHNARKIALRTAELSAKNFLVDTQLECARVLRAIYSMEGNPVKTKQQVELIDDLLLKNSYFDRIKGGWQELYSSTKYSMALDIDIAEKADDIFLENNEYLNLYDSPFLKLYHFRLGLFAHKHRNEFKEVNDTADRMLDLMKEYPMLKIRELLMEIYVEKATYYRTVKQYAHAQHEIYRGLKLSDYAAFDRFLIQAWHVDLLVKQEHYQQAYLIIQEVKETSQFTYLHAIDQAAWIMKETLLLLFTGKLDMKEFSYSRFLKNCNAATKDKRGYNVLFQYLSLLLQLRVHDHDLDAMGNKMMVYYYRHLKDLQEPRTRTFFFHLAKLASHNFSTDEVQKRTGSFLNELQLKSDESDYSEFIPYDRLWQWMIRLL